MVRADRRARARAPGRDGAPLLARHDRPVAAGLASRRAGRRCSPSPRADTGEVRAHAGAVRRGRRAAAGAAGPVRRADRLDPVSPARRPGRRADRPRPAAPRRAAPRRAEPPSRRPTAATRPTRPNERWVTDVLVGPWVPYPKRDGSARARLFLIVDDHSRLLVDGRFFARENARACQELLRRAITRRGLPDVFYADNGAPFANAWLARTCAVLGIRLVHSQALLAGRAGKAGKAEPVYPGGVPGRGRPPRASSRWTQLNDRFAAWAEQVANRRVHAETGQTADRPVQRRRPAPAGRPGPAAGEAFRWSVTRRVTRTATVPLEGNSYCRRSRARRPARRAAVRPGGPDPDRGVPGRPARRGRGAVRDRPARAPRRRPGRPARRRTRPGSTTSAWSPPPTTRKPAPARRSTSPGCSAGSPASDDQEEDGDELSPAPWAAHFGLARTPFGKSIAARDLFARQAHAEAIARISFCVVESALGVVTGDVGAGKTVALRAAVAGLDPTRHQVIYIANPAFGTRGLYVSVVRALGAQPRYLKAELMAQAGGPARRRDRRTAPPGRADRATRRICCSPTSWRSCGS